MLESVLNRRNASFKIKFAVKSLVSAGVVALAVVLPLIVHAAFGVSGGAKWLPMYLPVLVGGCVLGFRWGLGVGVVSPIASFLLTLAFGEPMPAATRLPYMIVELAVFAGVAGAFSKAIAENSLMAFPAVIAAAVAGRLSFITMAAVFQAVSPLSVEIVWAQIQTGLLALALQCVIVPLIVIGLTKLLKK